MGDCMHYNGEVTKNEVISNPVKYSILYARRDEPGHVSMAVGSKNS